VNAPTRENRTGILIHCALAAALVWIVFARAVSFEFLNWDDNSFVRDNPLVTMPGLGWTMNALTQAQAAYYAPVLWWAFRIQYAAWGPDPAGFHAVNILLHSVNAILLICLLRKVGVKPIAAFLAAGLWALHPLRAESVAWITELKDVLSGCFCLLCSIFYLKATSRDSESGNIQNGVTDSRAYYASLAFFLAALGTKPTVAIWPVLLMLYDFFSMRGRDALQRAPANDMAKHIARRLAPMCAMSVLFGLVMIHHQTIAPPLDGRAPGAWAVNLVVACYSMAFHLAKLILPTSLSALYTLPSPIPYSPFFPGANLASCRPYLSGVAFTVALIALTVFLFKRRPWLSFSLIFFMVGMSPLAQLIPTPRPLADRYTYLPSIALFAYFGSAFCRSLDFIPEKLRVVVSWPAAIILCAISGMPCADRLGVWRDSVSLWGDAIAKNASDQIAFGSYGLALIENGRFAEAREPMLKSAGAYPRDPRPWFHLCRIESFLGNEPLARDAAMKHMSLSYPGADALSLQREAARLLAAQKAGDAAVSLARGVAIRAKTEIRDETVRAEIALDMVFVEAKSLMDRGRSGEAATLLSDALERFPKWANGHLALGLALIDSGKFEQAETAFVCWKNLTGDEEAFIAWKSEIALKRGDTEIAEGLCRKGLSRFPGGVRLMTVMSRILVERGDFKGAVDFAGRAWLLAPDLPVVADAYAWALLKTGRDRKAMNVLDKHAANIWTEPEQAYHFSVILQANGRADRAKGFMNAATRWAKSGEKWLPDAEMRR